MPIYTIIAGVNGVGKSSLSGVLKTERNDLGHIIDVDKIGTENQCSSIDAGKIAVKRIRDFLSNGASFSQETTLSGYLSLKYVKLAKDKGYAVRMFYVGLDSMNESLSRIHNRVKKGGHDISPDDVERRYGKRFDDLVKILPYCNEVRFYDNENGFLEVGEYRAGELITKGEYRPLWIDELSKKLRSIYCYDVF